MYLWIRFKNGYKNYKPKQYLIIVQIIDKLQSAFHIILLNKERLPKSIRKPLKLSLYVGLIFIR